MGEVVRRRVIGALLLVGGLFILALLALMLQPPPVPTWEREAAVAAAEAILAKNEPSRAAEAFRKAVAVDPSPSNRQKLARALLASGQPDQAIEALQSDGAADSPTGAWLLSRAYLHKGDFERGASALASAGNYRAEHPIEPEPAWYVGAEKCAECHKENHDLETRSVHGRTFARAADLKTLPLPEGEVPDEHDPTVIHRMVRDGEEIRLETKAGTELFKTIVQYAFGSGDRGITFVGRDDKQKVRELRLSRYAEPYGWKVTSGQTPKPFLPSDFAGRPLNEDDLRGCFACHTTQAEAAQSSTGPTALDHAIGCETCHGPGGNHLKAVAAKWSDMAIARPREGVGGGGVALCARCHSPRSNTGQGVDPVEAIQARVTRDEVRFQGITLPRSRCFTASPGRLDCLTCHDPHRNASKEAGYYEAKCLDCHGSASGRAQTICKVNPKNGCIDCHMPKVRTAVPHSTFTDHHIRVHRTDATPVLPPPLLRKLP